MTIDATSFGSMVQENIAQFGVSVTYRRQTGASFTNATGVNAPTFSDTAVTAQRLMTAGMLGGPQNKRQEVRAYLVLASALAAEPGKGDRITDGSEVWLVKNWTRRASGLAYRLECARQE